MIVQTFDLNLIPNSAPVVVHCDQYDAGTGRLVATLYEGDVAYTPAAGATATIQGMKPDGKGFEYSATISGNTVTADITEQMTACYGKVRTQFVIEESYNRTGTFVFDLMVQKSALPADSDMSESEYQLVEELLDDIEQDVSDSEAWANGTRGGVPVGTSDPAYHNNSKYWSQQSASQTLEGLTDVNINDATLANGDSIRWNSTNEEWENAPSGGAGDFVTLYGVTPITANNADLNNYTTIGNYYKNDDSFACTNCPMTTTTALFRLKVDKIRDDFYSQTIYAANGPTIYASRYYLFYDATQEWTWGTWYIPALRNSYLSTFATVTFSSVATGQVLKFTDTNGRMANSYLSACQYDASNTLANIIGDVETLLAAL